MENRLIYPASNIENQMFLPHEKAKQKATHPSYYKDDTITNSQSLNTGKHKVSIPQPDTLNSHLWIAAERNPQALLNHIFEGLPEVSNKKEVLSQMIAVLKNDIMKEIALVYRLECIQENTQHTRFDNSILHCTRSSVAQDSSTPAAKGPTVCSSEISSLLSASFDVLHRSVRTFMDNQHWSYMASDMGHVLERQSAAAPNTNTTDSQSATPALDLQSSYTESGSKGMVVGESTDTDLKPNVRVCTRSSHTERLKSRQCLHKVQKRDMGKLHTCATPKRKNFQGFTKYCCVENNSTRRGLGTHGKDGSNEFKMGSICNTQFKLVERLYQFEYCEVRHPNNSNVAQRIKKHWHERPVTE